MRKFSKKMDRLLDMLRFTQEFREVERYAGMSLGTKPENDAEHSYQVAMIAWFLIDQEQLPLNKELCFMYAVAHDLIEIYAGDTPTYDSVKAVSKVQREKEALQKIKERFPYFKSLIHILEEYEKRETEESIFIYTLDKILPPLQIYMTDGKLWHANNMSYTDLLADKNHKIALSPVIQKYWHELLTEFEKHKDTLFPNKDTNREV